MADTTPTSNGLSAVHAPVQPPAATAENAVFKVAAPWSFMPAQNLFSSLTDGTFGAPQPTSDYEKKVIEWVPPTPSESAVPSWESGLPRPQPQMMDVNNIVDTAPVSPAVREERSESPIDVVNTSAFAPVLEVKKDEPVEIARPTPLRLDSIEGVNSLLVMPKEQPSLNLSSAFVLPADSVVVPTTEPGPSSAEQDSPPSKGCYTRAPGLGPPPETPTSSNGQTTYVCAVCGFSCGSKFHYNSHMNTHSDHKCTMCDYTSRTEGRLKKHMRESHSVEEQLAAGLDLSPPAAPAAPAAAPASLTSSPAKADTMDVEMAVDTPTAAPAIDSSPQTISSALLGLIANTSGSSLSALEHLNRAITEQPLGGVGDGSTEGLLLVGNPLGLSLSQAIKEESTPTTSGGGRRKMKVYKCKQCIHISSSKEEQWAHARTHIPCDKQMSCHKCNFVTEYKHHLEYHLRNHDGVKPFQCKKCNYMCVNKSMLNSHMKSHSNIYQFRCADCAYATKYCHSLKLHLRKYGHRRNMEGLSEADLLLGSLSAENSPPNMRKESNASIASSISGPFTPFSFIKKEEPTTPLAAPVAMFPMQLETPVSTHQDNLGYASHLLVRQQTMEQLFAQAIQQQQQAQQAQLLQQQQQQLQKCSFCDFIAGNHNDLLRHNLVAHFLNNYQLGIQASLAIPDRSADDDHHTTTGSPSGDDGASHSNGSAGSPLGSGRGSGDEGDVGSSRRKSKPSRIDEIGLRLIDKASPDRTLMANLKQEAMETDDQQASATADITATNSVIVLPPQEGGGSLLVPAAHAVSSAAAAAPIVAAAAPLVAAAAPLLDLPGMGMIRSAYLSHLATQVRQPADLFPFECTHCRMGFADQNLHTIHMTYHAPGNPLHCARCSTMCSNALHFNLHLLNASHI